MPGPRPIITVVTIAAVAVLLARCSSAVANPIPTGAPVSAAPTAAPATVAPATAAPTVAPASAAPSSAAPSSAAPSVAAPATPAPSVAAATAAPPAAPSAGGTATVKATSVGSLGTVLVAGSNGMTVYNFVDDRKNSGRSACSGDCITTWPALTVEAGVTPKAGPGLTGTLGTIRRADDGAIQVTYNGLPLYFFSGDSKPGDSNGVYPDWMSVKP